MKIKKIVVGLLAAGSILASTSLMALIANSAHDLTSTNPLYGASDITAICEPCHVPHNPGAMTAGAPLWNHTLSTVAAYTLYTSTTLNAAVAQPDTLSKLCLSCHDGTVAIANYGGYTGGLTTEKVGTAPWNNLPSSNVGTDLSNDHPVGITYDATLATADGGLFNPDTKTVTVGAVTDTIKVNMMSNAYAMGCATCHDVHNSFGLSSLLKVTNAGSVLCITCHNK